jgi:hypothetical protein
MAEVVHHFFPRLVDLHNYDQGLRIDTKIYNWKTLSSKVLKKLNLELDTETVTALANARIGVIEEVLWNLRQIVIGKSKQRDKAYFEDMDSPELAALSLQQSASDRKLLLEKIEECEEQKEYIQALEAKIAKLEELMKLKDAKIARLSGKAKKPAH